MRLLAALVLSATALTGCTLSTIGLGPSTPPTAYTLQAVPNAAAALPKVQWQLLVEEPTTVSRFDTPRIALSQGGTRLDYYADVAWADRLPALVQSRLVESFEKSGKIQSVAREAAGLRGDYSLKLDLREFQANYPGTNTNVAPVVSVRIAAKLIDLQRRDILASEDFEASAQARGSGLNEIVAALDTASQQVLGRIVEWTLIQGSRNAAPPAPSRQTAPRPRGR